MNLLAQVTHSLAGLKTLWQQQRLTKTRQHLHTRSQAEWYCMLSGQKILTH